MALMMRARPVLARARPQMTKRMLTQTSAEARRYSFAHAIDDIAAAPTNAEMVARVRAHGEEVAGRLKHGWFRDGVTHPNSDIPPDGLPRMTWEDKVVDKLNPSNVYTYTPTQMVGATLVTFGTFVTVVANVIGASSASSKKAELAKKDAEEMGK